MKKLVLLAASITLAACVSGKTPDGPGRYQSLAAPTPADVALKITALSDGQNVSVKVGTKVAVELIGTPTAGYVWKVVDRPGFLQPAGEYGGPTSSAQLEEGFAGGNHWEAFLFTVTAAGEGELRLSQGRPWEDKPGGDGAAFSVYVFAEE